ncbi:hypothetical protein JYK02_20750 [Corallococcus macrosporus]|uniref:Uncharacterized protein n=1 Tax=Corallococcus macrosporus TaxID=35 RepID=A0ABS3DFF8_9BACT|nr:hypothetical protein [Corallococcus macrosporus]MBN8229946.1 hypothetical protein [Corallococcus macrosporus]
MPLDREAPQKTRVYTKRAPVAEVLGDLRAMDPRPPPAPEAQPGPDPEQQARKARRLGLGLLLAAVVSFVILRLLPSEQEGLSVLFGFVCFLTLFGGFMVLIVSFTGGVGPLMETSRFMEERFLAPYKEQRRLLLATLLQRFQVDLDAKAPVDVTLDLTSPLAQGNRVHHGKHGTGTREDFVQPWLSLRGPFADGTELRLSVVDQVRILRRTKTTALKSKTKQKRSGGSLMTVALRVKPERYPGLAAMEAHALGAVRLPPGARLKRVRVAEDRVELRVLLDEDWVAQAPRAPSKVPPDEAEPADEAEPDASRTVTMMLLSLYQVLNHSSSRGQPGNVRSTS